MSKNIAPAIFTNEEGTVYLIHLDTPIAGRSCHYIGWASPGNLDRRFNHHLRGSGARFLAVANALGIRYRIVRTWAGGKTLERRLKNQKKARCLCPVCHPRNAQPNL